MTEYELLAKIREAVKALDDYKKDNTSLNKSSLWHDDIQKETKDLITKSHVLGSAGRPCSKCGGSGVEN